MFRDPFLDKVTQICLALPEATKKMSHGAESFFAGKARQFCAYRCNGYSDMRPVIWCPAPAGVQSDVVEHEPDRFFVPPYVGVSGWIGVRLDVETDWAEIAGVIEDAYRKVALKRQLKALDEVQAEGHVMRTRRLGPLDVSEVGLGCNNLGWRLDENASIEVVHAALDAGINFFDTADVYGANFEDEREGGDSERFLGKALKGRRDEAVVATKFGSPMGKDPARGGASQRWIAQAVEDSLQRLDTDHIDLYQLHRDDPDVPIEETIGALSELVEADVVPACERQGLALLPFFPLASGMLTGKIRRGAEPPAGSRLADTPADRRGFFVNDAAFDVIERLEAWAGERDHSLVDLAFAWLLSHDVVASVIAGATTPAQVRANATTATWVLTATERAEVATLAETLDSL